MHSCTNEMKLATAQGVCSQRCATSHSESNSSENLTLGERNNRHIVCKFQNCIFNSNQTFRTAIAKIYYCS